MDMWYFARICAHARRWRDFAKCRFSHFPSFFSVHVDTYDNHFMSVAGNWNRIRSRNRWWKYYRNRIRNHSQIDWNRFRIRNQKVYQNRIRNRWRWIHPRSASRMFRLNLQCNQRLICSPKRVDLTNQKRLAVYAWANRDVFEGFLSSRRHHLPSKVKLRYNQTERNVYMWMQQ